MKPMRFDFKNSNPFSFPSLAHKRNHLFVKFAVFSLLVGLAFRLFVSNPIQFPSETTDPSSPVEQNATFPPPADTSPVSSDLPVDESLPANESLTSQNGERILFFALPLLLQRIIRNMQIKYGLYLIPLIQVGLVLRCGRKKFIYFLQWMWNWVEFPRFSSFFPHSWPHTCKYFNFQPVWLTKFRVWENRS